MLAMLSMLVRAQSEDDSHSSSIFRCVSQ